MVTCFKVTSSQTYGFSSSHMWIWDLDYKESWALKNWCFWTVVLEKTLESPLDCKEIKPVHPRGNQSWIFIGRNATEAEALILWPPDAKHWSFNFSISPSSEYSGLISFRIDWFDLLAVQGLSRVFSPLLRAYLSEYPPQCPCVLGDFSPLAGGTMTYS